METPKLTKAEIKSLKKKIVAGIAGLFLSVGALIGFANVTPVHARTIWVGELQNCGAIPTCNPGAGDVLNVDLYEGWLGGVDPGTRCAGMGGTLGKYSGLGWVCFNVDF